MNIDILEVIRRHAESHRSLAESDAYSAQEAPRLEAAISVIEELLSSADECAMYLSMSMQHTHELVAHMRICAALVAAQGGKSDG